MLSSDKTKKGERFFTSFTFPCFNWFWAYAVRGPKRASFAASPSDRLISCDGEFDLGDAVIREEPFSFSM